MNLIVAIIKPFKLEEVRTALTELGVEGMTVTEVKGFGRQEGHPEVYRGSEYTTSFVPKMRLEVAVPASQAAAVIDAITGAARTGRIGDGKIFTGPMEQAVRVRTDESGDGVLWNGGTTGTWRGPDSSRAA
jgi:nitrogen regulatory protein PII